MPVQQCQAPQESQLGVGVLVLVGVEVVLFQSNDSDVF